MAEQKMPSPEQMKKMFEAMMARTRAGHDKVCPTLTEELSTEEVWIPSNDGAKMRTIILKPVGVEGPWPTIVMRSCYPHMEAMLRNQAESFARHGFAVAYQWCRGINGSEGQWEPNIYDRADGLSMVNWLQAQDCCSIPQSAII